jgi:hypothetical protein
LVYRLPLLGTTKPPISLRKPSKIRVLAFLGTIFGTAFRTTFVNFRQ